MCGDCGTSACATAVPCPPQAASLQALTAVVRALSRPLLPSGGGRGALGEFLEMVKKGLTRVCLTDQGACYYSRHCTPCIDCQRYLREPELRLMRAAGCLLQAVARASDPACVAVTSSAVPLLLEQLTHQTQVLPSLPAPSVKPRPAPSETPPSLITPQ